MPSGASGNPSSPPALLLALLWLQAPPAGARADCCTELSSLVGPGGLAAEAPGGEAEGGVWRRRHGAEEEAGRELGPCSAEEPALAASTCTGEAEAVMKGILGKRASSGWWEPPVGPDRGPGRHLWGVAPPPRPAGCVCSQKIGLCHRAQESPRVCSGPTTDGRHVSSPQTGH